EPPARHGLRSTAMSFTPQHLFFDDVEVGQNWLSLGRTITEADIVNFAGLSGDFNPIHIDHEFARTTPFRRPIAHGLLVFSIRSEPPARHGLRSTAMSFTPQHLFFDDVEVGQNWLSLGRTITEADIVNFAGLSGDFNPIHIDHEFARTTPFRRPIAHGLLVFSI